LRSSAIVSRSLIPRRARSDNWEKVRTAAGAYFARFPPARAFISHLVHSAPTLFLRDLWPGALPPPEFKLKIFCVYLEVRKNTAFFSLSSFGSKVYFSFFSRCCLSAKIYFQLVSRAGEKLQ